MKRFFILLVVILFPFFSVFGQVPPMPVFDGFVVGALENSKFENFLYYGQQLFDNAQAIGNTVTQIEYMTKQWELAIKNLTSFPDIKDWDDFMSWYNRQLYLERQAGRAFDNINVKIGKKSYHFTDIENMAYGFKDEYVDYWDFVLSDIRA